MQIYSTDELFIHALDGFVSGGIEKGEVTVNIATPVQLAALERKLNARGFNLSSAQSRQLYLPLDANEVLDTFMVRGWPDESLLQHFIHGIVGRAAGRQVRVFGGMTALMLERGQSTALLRLEQLWHRICEKNRIALFCAYRRGDFKPAMDSWMRAICATHSCVIG